MNVLELRRYLVIELKPKEFDPRDLGQLSFYMSAVNKTLKRNDEMTIIINIRIK